MNNPSNCIIELCRRSQKSTSLVEPTVFEARCQANMIGINDIRVMAKTTAISVAFRLKETVSKIRPRVDYFLHSAELDQTLLLRHVLANVHGESAIRAHHLSRNGCTQPQIHRVREVCYEFSGRRVSSCMLPSPAQRIRRYQTRQSGDLR